MRVLFVFSTVAVSVQAHSECRRAISAITGPVVMSSFSSPIDEALETNAPVINSMISSCIGVGGSERKARIKSTADEVCALLMEKGLAYKEVMPLFRICVHPENRFKSGLTPSDVHELLELILEAGFSFTEMVGARSFELAPGKEGDKQFDAYRRIQTLSMGTLPTLSRDDVRILTVACSHTVSGLLCADQGVNSNAISEKYCIDGKISKEKVIEACPSINAPLKNGIEFLIIRHQVEAKCPQLPEFLQEAGNANKGVERKPTKVQLMLQISSRVVAGISETSIVRSIESQHEHVRGEVKDLIAFARQWSGGIDPVFIKDIDAFTKTLKVQRELPSIVIGALAKCKMAEWPEYIVACVKAMIAAPDTYVSKGKSTLLSTSDVDTIDGKNKKLSVEAASYMRKARVYTDRLVELGLGAGCADRARGTLECLFVSFVHAKKIKSKEVRLKSLKDIADKFVRSIELEMTPGTCPDRPWEVEEAPTETVQPAASAPRNFTSCGLLDASVLQTRGFAEGAFVEDCDGAWFQIVKIRDQVVDVVPHGCKIPIISKTVAQSIDMYTKVDMGKATTELSTPLPDPSTTSAMIEKLYIARCTMALHKVWLDVADVDVTCTVAPTRKVCVNKAYRQNGLVLVPLTPHFVLFVFVCQSFMLLLFCVVVAVVSDGTVDTYHSLHRGES